MWNKIGELLNYPETWCSFIIRFSLLVCLVLMLLFVLISPLILYIAKGATVDFYFVSVVAVLLFYILHVIAKDVFYEYAEFLDKLPKCRKISWDNKGE
jgi:hypothetical protein